MCNNASRSARRYALTTIRKASFQPLPASQPWSAPLGSPNTRPAPHPLSSFLPLPLPELLVPGTPRVHAHPHTTYHLLYLAPRLSTSGALVPKSQLLPPNPTLLTSPVAPSRSSTQPISPPRPNHHPRFPHRLHLRAAPYCKRPPAGRVGEGRGAARRLVHHLRGGAAAGGAAAGGRSAAGGRPVPREQAQQGNAGGWWLNMCARERCVWPVRLRKRERSMGTSPIGQRW